MTSYFENCICSKLTYFLYHNLRKVNSYKKQAEMFYQNDSLALRTVEIFTI